MAPPSRHARNIGQIIEYIPDRLYLAAYVHPPTAETLFPGSQHSPTTPKKRSRPTPCYFTVDDTLLYNAFHHDFGPLHIGHLYRFAIRFHDILSAQENKDRPVVFYSAADPRSKFHFKPAVSSSRLGVGVIPLSRRANATCMLACYMVLIQHWPPHLALAPIAQIDPPLMPFRDAGYSQADYGIAVQDVVYGVWRAMEEKCCNLDGFDLDAYEKFERVEHGDFNWITPHFLAFASPQHEPVTAIAAGSDLAAALPRDVDAVDAHRTLPQAFKNVLTHFSAKRVGLVVRLNSPLYSASYFEALGIPHLDMIFDDGTCPPLTTVRKFIKLAHEVITVKKRSVAVHCKAGLGRTGCLIGAYLIYRHGFTANEVIAFMRFMRPGMVVGPQQHWLHLNQGTFREWWVEERLERRLRRELLAAANAAATTPMRALHKSAHRNGQTATPPPPPHRSPSSRTPLSEVDQDRHNVGVQDEFLPAPTPGQPRKSARPADRHHHPHPPHKAHRKASPACYETTIEAEHGVEHETEIVKMHHRQSLGAESDEEIHMRVRSHRKASGSPARNGVTRSVSQTTSRLYLYDNDASHDIENVGSLRGKPAADRGPGASGVLTKVRTAGASKRGSVDTSLKLKDSAGIRKTSGRVGSAGLAVSTTATAVARKVSGS